LELKAGTTTASFDAKTGLLKSLRRGDQVSAFTNGPRVVYARPANGEIPWQDAAFEVSGTTVMWKPATPQLLNLLEIDLGLPKIVNWAGFKLEISSDGKVWKTLYDATRRNNDGNVYEFPPQTVAAVRLSEFRQVDGGLPAVKRLRAAYQAERFPVVGEPEASSGPDWVESVSRSHRFRWTLAGSGELRLSYSYGLDGEVTYHGITFDHPEEQFESVKWQGEGPYRVWQNRLPGTWLGVHEIARNDIQPGESWKFPEFQGFFAGLRWARFQTTSGPLTVTSPDAGTYLRIGTPRISHPFTTVAFPAGDVSFLKVIPAIGSKFITPGKTGPASQPVKVAGEQAGTLVFRFGE
jgi:hypothetical protein